MQYCWEFHDRLWEALSGTTSEKKKRPQPYWGPRGERILEMLWKPQMPRIIGFNHPSRTLDGNSRKRSESVSGVFPEFFRNFLREVPAVLGVWPIIDSETGQIQFRRAWLQTLWARLRGESSVSPFRPFYLCVGRNLPSFFFAELAEFAAELSEFSSQTVLSKQYSPVSY